MEINIVYCTDNNFVDICIISMISVMKNKNDENISFYIMDNHISSENRYRIINLVKGYSGCEVNFIQFPDLGDKLSTTVKFNKKHISISSFGRLFVGDILPEDIEKIIYLDCDTVVMGSLLELFTYNMQEKIVGGIDDCKSKKYRWVLGLPLSAPYINAGVLLINLKLWNEMQCEKKFIEYIEKNNGVVHFADQGTINATLYNEICLLPMKYNVMTHNYDFSFNELMKFRQPVLSYRKEEIEKNIRQPIIIHFTSSFMTSTRVWYSNSNHKKRELYCKYMKENDFETREKVFSKREKIRILFIDIFPRWLIIFFATFFHEYYEPLKFKMIMKVNQNLKTKNQRISKKKK